jgi:serine/threonine protein kinase
MAVAEHGPLPADLCRALLAALAEGLTDIHTHGVWHRDIKPQNVILSATGPQLIDFGIARGSEQTALTQVGHSMGTPGYTAPEILTHNDVGPAGDVFAIGATIAFAATGRPPYGEGLSTAIAYRSVHENIDLDGVDPALADLISACVARDPHVRLSPDEIIARCRPQASLVDHPAYHHALTSSSTTTALPTPPAIPAVPPPDQLPQTTVLPAAPAGAEMATTALPTGTPPAAPLHVPEFVQAPGVAFNDHGAQSFHPSAPGSVPRYTRQRRGRFILMGTAGVAALAAVLIVAQHSGQNNTQSAGATATATSPAPATTNTPVGEQTADTSQSDSAPTNTPSDKSLDTAPANGTQTAQSSTDRCTAGQLQLSINTGEAGAGHVSYSISLVNDSPSTCVLSGFPGVSLQSADGQEIGKPADRAGSAGAPVTLQPGTPAEAVLETLNGDGGSGCWGTPARMTVYPPGSKESLAIDTSSPTVCGDEFTVTALQPVKW